MCWAQGTRNAGRPSTEQFLATVAVLPFDAIASRCAAEIRHELERGGQGIGPLDTLIAATAFANNATLVTHNVREFGRVQGLKLVDWYS